MQDQSFFTIAEVAAKLRYGQSTIRKRIAEGKLGALKDGYGLTRIPSSDFEAFVASMTPRTVTRK